MSKYRSRSEHSLPVSLMSPEEDSSESQRAPGRVLGGVTAVLMTMLFVFPDRAYPMQTLTLLFCIALVTLLTLVRAIAEAPVTPSRIVLRLNMIGVWALALFGIWTLLRWQTMTLIWRAPPESAALYKFGEILTPLRHAPSSGLPRVAGVNLMIPFLLLGWALGSLRRPLSEAAGRAFRFMLLLAAVAFSAHGIYQYFVGYDHQLALFQESLSDPAHPATQSPLMIQSLVHALREKRIGGNLGNGNLFACLLAVLATLSLSHFGGRSRDRAPRWMASLAALAYLLSVFTIFLTQSRGGLLTLIVGTIIGAVILVRSSDLKLINRAHQIAVPISLVVLAASYAWQPRHAEAASFGERLRNISTIRERLNYWGIARVLWGQNPVIGAGPGAFELYYPSLKPPQARESKYAHSWLFQAGAETGWIGVALFATFVIAASWPALRYLLPLRLDEPGGETPWFSLACGLLAFNGLFEYSLQEQEFLASFALMAGFVFGMRRPVEAQLGEGYVAAQPWKPIALALVLGIPLCAAGWLVVPLERGTFWEWEARLATQEQRPDLAAINYLNALHWQPDNEGYWAARALAIYTADRSLASKSEVLLEEAQMRNPLSARIRHDRADLLESQGRIDEAGTRLDEMVALYPNDAGNRMDRALFNLRHGRVELAREDLEYIQKQGLLIWDYQKQRLEALRKRLEGQ